MPINIAVAGKGGTGKTTTTGLIIDYLRKNHKEKGPILAIDADANANLNEVLGEEVECTIGKMREKVAREMKNLSGLEKNQYLEYNVQSAIVEAVGYDLIVMGRPEGPGCYCFVNNLLRDYIDVLAKNYAFVVMDNEAGMEHISRKTTRDVDALLIISDASRRGVQAAGRIQALAREVNINVKQMGLIVTKAPDGKLDAGIEEEIKKQDLNLLGVIPMDPQVYAYDCAGKPTVDLPEDSLAKQEVKKIMQKLGL
ncbi:MAG: AAA family ATPase [bacterium]